MGIQIFLILSTMTAMNASRLIMQVLKDQGPLTNQRLYAACLDLSVAPVNPHIYPAPPPSTPAKPSRHQKIAATDTFPNPDHAIRSLTYLKKTMKFLEAHKMVKKMTFSAFKKRCDEAGLAATTANAKDLRPLNSGEFVWVPAETMSQIQDQIKALKKNEDFTKNDELPPSLWKSDPDFNLIDAQVSMIRTPNQYVGKRVDEKSRILSLVTGEPVGKARPDNSQFPPLPIPRMETDEGRM